MPASSAEILALLQQIREELQCLHRGQEYIVDPRTGHMSWHPGKVRVGTIRKGGRFTPGPRLAQAPGFTSINVCSYNKSGLGAQISPYMLRDAQGRLMENLWQFAKYYQHIPAVGAKTHLSGYTDWTWPAERHAGDDLLPNAKYWAWRKAGMEYPTPVRYPVGHEARHSCLYAMWPKSGSLADATNPQAPMRKCAYVDSRRFIYGAVFRQLVKQTADYWEIKRRLWSGENLCLLDVDGPRPYQVLNESTGRYYYPAPYDQMLNAQGEPGTIGEPFAYTLEINAENIGHILNDTHNPMGHAYFLACMILEHEEWVA